MSYLYKIFCWLQYENSDENIIKYLFNIDYAEIFLSHLFEN